MPRLSVDIDLNYVGSADRETMLAERPQIEQAMHAVFERQELTIRRMPTEHAGGKWSLRYHSATGQMGNLEVDLNCMYRFPLWPVISMDSHFVGSWQATDVPVIDIHELAAGKLAASTNESINSIRQFASNFKLDHFFSQHFHRFSSLRVMTSTCRSFTH